MKQTDVQLKSLDALLFLPDYLLEECIDTQGAIESEDLNEFRPATLYMQQMIRLLPREVTARFKLTPAFEESLMRIEEANN